MACRVKVLHGPGDAAPVFESKKYASAVRSGKFFIQSTSDAESAAISINSAAYILMKDFVSDDATFLAHKLLGADYGEIPVDTYAPFLVIQPGLKIRSSEFSSSGTDSVGTITASTAVRTALSVNSLGSICEKQTTGEGSTQIAILTDNDIATDGTITYRIVAVPG